MQKTTAAIHEFLTGLAALVVAMGSAIEASAATGNKLAVAGVTRARLRPAHAIPGPRSPLRSARRPRNPRLKDITPSTEAENAFEHHCLWCRAPIPSDKVNFALRRGIEPRYCRDSHRVNACVARKRARLQSETAT